jgi:hypothetical protein
VGPIHRRLGLVGEEVVGMELTDKERVVFNEAIAELRGIGESLREMPKIITEKILTRPADLPEEERDRITGLTLEMSETEAVSALLTLHKLVESQSYGQAFTNAQMEGTILLAVLARFAPDATREALEQWGEDCEIEDLEDLWKASDG